MSDIKDGLERQYFAIPPERRHFQRFGRLEMGPAPRPGIRPPSPFCLSESELRQENGISAMGWPKKSSRPYTSGKSAGYGPHFGFRFRGAQQDIRTSRNPAGGAYWKAAFANRQSRARVECN